MRSLLTFYIQCKTQIVVFVGAKFAIHAVVVVKSFLDRFKHCTLHLIGANIAPICLFDKWKVLFQCHHLLKRFFKKRIAPWIVPRSYKKTGDNLFFNAAPKLWNQLPCDVWEAVSTSVFKRSLLFPTEWTSSFLLLCFLDVILFFLWGAVFIVERHRNFYYY